ncbi:MAG: SdpI family protein [Ferruginibacter sp.]
MEKFMKKIIWLIICIPPIYVAMVWNSLPASIGMHYDLQGNIDRYGDKTELLTMIMILTAINVAVYLLLPNIYRIDPKKHAAENKSRLYRISFAVVIFLTAVLCMIINSSINGNIQANTRFIITGVGLLFAVIGNYMYTIKPNYFAGFRLPWTLNNDENWRLTHLLGGKLFFTGGLLIAVCSLFTPFLVSIIIMFVTVTIIVVITCVYSYRLYKKQSPDTGN